MSVPSGISGGDRNMSVYHGALITSLDQSRRYGPAGRPNEVKGKMSRTPWTSGDVKGMLEGRMRTDEFATRGHLRANASEPGTILRHVKPTRPEMREAYAILRVNRAAQVSLASLLAATRFKCIFDGNLHPTRCPRWRGREGSFDHMLTRCGLLVGGVRGKTEVIFLVDVARRALTATHGISEPFDPEISEHFRQRQRRR